MAAICGDGEIIFGMQLPVQTLTRTLRASWEPDASVEDLIAIAQNCETAGFSFVGVCDHIAIPDDDYSARMSTTWYDTVATLGFLAAHTSTIRLLSVVWIAAYRHPLQTAKSFATLDHLSDGRVILGVGAGHVAGEFEAMGVDFSKRGALLNECIDGVRAALAGTAPGGESDEPGYSSFSGETYSWENCGVGPKPQQGELPIWVGGTTPPAFRRVGARGDGWIPMGTPKEHIPAVLETIRQAAADAGRSNPRFDIGHMPGTLYVGEPPEELAPTTSLSGTPEAIAEELLAACELGANVLHLRFSSRTQQEFNDQIAAFGQQVAPLLPK